MAIDATQSTDLVRSLTRENLQAGPKGKVELKKLEDEDKKQGLHKQDESFSLFGDDGLSFWDVLDVFNPLQHIPVVNAIYREITGDEIDPAMKLAGGALFGGFIGLGAAAVDVAIEGATGKDLGEHAIALATEDVGETPDPTVIVKSHEESDEYIDGPLQKVAEATPDASTANQTVAIAATNAAVIAAADPKTINGLSKQTFSELPDWDAKAEPVSFASGSVASLNAPPKPTTSSDKVFPMPDRRFRSDRDSAKSVAELRAESMSAPVTQSTLTSASQLSPEAMRAAGLTQDMVDDVLRHHGKTQDKTQSKAEQTASTTAQQTAELGATNSTGGLESAWMFSTMNQALDKYQAASTLKSNQSSTAIQPMWTQ